MTRRTSIDVDDEKLERVQHVLGTRGLKDTVERAFDEVLRADLRRRLADQIRTGEGIERSQKLLKETRPTHREPVPRRHKRVAPFCPS